MIQRLLLSLALALGLGLAAPAFAADQTPLKSVNAHPTTFGTGDTVGVAHGGTGAVSLTAHCVLVGAGASAAHLVCPTMSGYVLTDNGSGADPSFQAVSGGSGTVTTTGSPVSGNLTKFSGATSITSGDLSGDVTTSGTLATTIASNAVTTAKINNGAVTEAKITLANNTTNNVTTSAHGLAPILPNDATKYLDGTGAYSVPTGSGGLPSIASGHIIGNSTAGSATAADSTVTAILDRVFSSTQGAILYRDASAWSALTAGTAGYPLVSNGPGTSPSYQPAGGPGGGSLVLLEQHTASSSSSLNFTTCISSSYDEYQIEMVNIIPSAAAEILFRMSTNGGSSYDATSVYSSGEGFGWGTGSSGAGSGTATGTSISLRPGTGSTITANGSWNGTFRLYNPLSAANWKFITGQGGWFDNSLGPVSFHMAGVYRVTTAANAFQWLPGTGTFTSGTVRCYGIAK